MINTAEIIIIVIAMAALVGVARRIAGTTIQAVLMTLALAPALFLAVEGATQFLTCDETYIILELEDVKNARYMQWNMNAFRTSVLVTGSLVKIFDGIVLPENYSIVDLHRFAKSMHLLVGFSVLLMIHEALRRYAVPRDKQSTFFVAFFTIALLLPTNILAFKVANYDLLSTMLGVLSITLTLGALTSRTLMPAIGAVITGTLASQEKLIASPFLALALFAVVFITATWNTSKKERPTWQRVASGYGLALLACIGTALLTWMIVKSVHGGLTISLSKALSPVISFLGPVATMFNPAYATTGLPGWMIPLYFLFVLCIGIIASALLRVLAPRLSVQSISRKASPIALTVMFILVLIGIAGTYSYTVYVHPMHPTLTGTYLPTRAFNDVIVHYMQPTYAAHMQAIIASSYGIIANSIPTALWVMTFACGLVLWRREESSFAPNLWVGTALFMFAFPIAYAITETPIGSRYLNLFLFVIAAYAAMIITDVLTRTHSKYSIALGAVCSLMVVAELFSFRPIVGSFTPLWNRPDAVFASMPTPGIGRTGYWGGWGEENAIAGKRIVDEFRKGDEPIQIFYSYPGEWLTDEPNVAVVRYDRARRSIGVNDYYIISRAAAGQKRYPFPWGVKPLFTVDYGGATMAWVFRGDQLRDNLMFAVPENQGGYVAEMSELKDRANGPNNPAASSLIVYEDGKPMGPPHAPFDEIRKIGKGRYNHWENVVFFTASDNTDPRVNGRRYTVGLGQP